MELAILHGIQGAIGCAPLDAIMAFFTQLGENGMIWFLIALFMLIFPKTRAWGVAVIVGIACVWVVGDQIIKPLVVRPRPFLVDPTIQLVVEPPTGFSFPSGHSSSSLVAATIIAFAPIQRKWKVSAWTLAILIAFSRIYLCVHNPTDVLAGAALGLAIGVLVVLALQKFFDWYEGDRELPRFQPSAWFESIRTFFSELAIRIRGKVSGARNRGAIRGVQTRMSRSDVQTQAQVSRSGNMQAQATQRSGMQPQTPRRSAPQPRAPRQAQGTPRSIGQSDGRKPRNMAYPQTTQSARPTRPAQSAQRQRVQQPQSQQQKQAPRVSRPMPQQATPNANADQRRRTTR